jgi:hypothetical protein
MKPCANCRRPSLATTECRGTVSLDTVYTDGPAVDVTVHLCAQCRRLLVYNEVSLLVKVHHVRPRSK